MNEVGDTVPLSVGFNAMCKNKERKAENSVGGAVAVGAGVETLFFEDTFEWSSLRPALIVDSRRRKGKGLSPGGLGIGVAGGAGVGGRAAGSGNGSDPSLNSQTNCRKGLQKYKACNMELA